MKRIPVTRSSMPPFEEYIDEIKKLWDSRWLTNMGVEHRQLQADLEAYLECSHVVLHANGHMALENTIAAMQFPAGSEVITTPFTFASTTHAIVRNGLVPVFCDVREDDYTIDAEKIEALITEKTKAIVPVHVYGHICDVDTIQDIAKRHELRVIYDAAHAFGVRYRGISSANFGDASIFSFHATKVFNTIEGGAVCFHDEYLREALNDLKNFGIRGPEEVAAVGGNAKMNEFQAAMGICNLRHFESEIALRKTVADHYRERLKDNRGIRLCARQPEVTSNEAYFPIIFQQDNRDEIYNRLIEHEIYARKYFYPLSNSFDCYSHAPYAGADKTPVAAWLAERVLTLPLYADLSFDEVDRICDIINRG